MDVRGRTALITGGATGIGKCCAQRLADLGARVAINYSRSEEEANLLVQELTLAGCNAIAVKADVSEDTAVKRMMELVLDTFRSIDIVVNNAGRTHYVDLHDLDAIQEAQWDEIFNTNVKGTFFVTRACAKELKRSKGCVINVASIAGIMGQGSSIPYAASKGALINLTKCLARSLAPNVRVNAVAPGIVKTRWVTGHEEHIERLSKGTLMERVAEAEDVADAILGLILHGDFITAQTVVVDGGYCFVT